MSMIIGFIFLILIGVTIIIFKILIEKAEAGEPEQQTIKESKKTPAKQTISQFIGIMNINQGIVILEPGTHYRLYIRVGSINYYLMSEEEKQGVIYGLLGLASSFTFPIQLFTTTELIDTSMAVKEIKDSYDDLHSEMKEYARYMVEALTALRFDRSVLVKHNYIIVPYDTKDSFEQAKSELTRRGLIILDGLNKTGMKAKILTTPEVTNVLHGVFNRQDVLIPATALEEGGLDLYVSQA